MITQIIDNLKKYKYPNKIELNYNNELNLLIAILLSAQSRDSIVNVCTKELFNIATKPEDYLNLGIQNLTKYINKIGLYNVKSKNILLLCNQIINLKNIKNVREWFEGFKKNKNNQNDFKLFGPILSTEGIPSFKFGLLNLAGIGIKSANVFLNEIYNARTFPVDTHVKRLSNRLNLSNSKNVKIIEKELEEQTPLNETQLCNMLVYHGRRVCIAKKPKCNECLLKNYCFFFSKSILYNHV